MDTQRTPDHWPEALVLLLAHGSETTPGAAQLVKRHAATLKSQNLFADARAAFLRDTPHPRDVIDASPHKDIYIVPFMISEGYSIEVLIPEALGLTGPLTERISKQGRRRIHLCHSIGTHDAITDEIVTTVNTLIKDNSLASQDTSVLIAAHGTKRHPGNNQQSTGVAASIANRCPVQSAHAIFLEEPPFITDWQSLSTGPNTIGIPHLMTTGSHATIDVPEMLGIPNTHETFGPHHVAGRYLWYTPVVGSFSSIPEIAVDRIHDWDRANAG